MSDVSDFVALEAATAATQQAPDRVRGVLLRPGTVMEVSTDRGLAEVVIDQDEEEQGDPVGADIVTPTYLSAGDRVMVLFSPPRGALIIGKLDGGYDPWHNIGDDVPFTAGWAPASGTGYPGSATFALPGYKRVGEIAYLRGRAHRTSGVSLTIANLPADYTPRNDLVFWTVGGPIVAEAVVVVRQSGNIDIVAGSADSGVGGFISLDGISYSID